MSENLASWAGEQMAGGAAGAVGASLFNYGLSQLGIPLPGNDSSSALAAIQQTLNQIVSMLNDIENEMAAMKQEMEFHFDQSDYRNAVSALEPKVTAIFSLTKDYHFTVSNSSPNTLSDISLNTLPGVDQQFLDAIANKLLFEQSVIHNTITPFGVPSVYELFADILRREHRFLSYKDSDAMQSRINYYQSAQYLQSLLLTIYHHAQNTQKTTQNGGTLVDDASTKKRIDEVLSTYCDNLVAENRFQILPIPEGMVYDQKSHLRLWVKNCDEVDWNTAQAKIAESNEYNLGGCNGWELPSLAELISSDKVDASWILEPLQNWPVGVFTEFDSQGGKISPAEWLHKNGVPEEYYLEGLRFWTRDTATFPSIGSNYYIAITNEDTLFEHLSAVPSSIRHTLRTSPIEFFPYPMASYGDAGYRRVVTLKADNGKYWSAIFRNVNAIEAAKDTPDDFCKFTVLGYESGKITLGTNKGTPLSRINRGDRNPIEVATDPSPDPSCVFTLTALDIGKVTLRADNGKYLSCMERGDTQPIEAVKDAADASCEFELVTYSLQKR